MKKNVKKHVPKSSIKNIATTPGVIHPINALIHSLPKFTAAFWCKHHRNSRKKKRKHFKQTYHSNTLQNIEKIQPKKNIWTTLCTTFGLNIPIHPSVFQGRYAKWSMKYRTDMKSQRDLWQNPGLRNCKLTWTQVLFGVCSRNSTAVTFEETAHLTNQYRLNPLNGTGPSELPCVYSC